MTAAVRPAVASDVAAVWPLVQDFATSSVPRRDAVEAAFARLLETPTSLLLVADDDGAIVGYLAAHRHDALFANAPLVWIEEVMVAESHRREGVGGALMAGAEAWAREAGAAYTSLSTRRAPEFYRALGYEESGTFFKKPAA
jgi:GNAT superfamily N-acetyltransferase